MAPQMVAGAVIAFSESDLYPLFELCGRAVAMSAQTDQTIGGLTMWIPAALVEVVGLMMALGTLMRLSAKGRLRKADRDARARGPRRLGLIRPFSGISPFRPEPAVAYSGISPWYLRPSATVAWNMPALLPQS